MEDNLSSLFQDHWEFGGSNFASTDSPENLFDVLQSLEGASNCPPSEQSFSSNAYDDFQKPKHLTISKHESETNQVIEEGSCPAHKKLKISFSSSSSEEVATLDGQQHIRSSHIIVERNRRKKMNENLSVLRSLMPSFYIKRADQASVIGGVISFIKELQQVLHSLEEKKQRKAYNEVLSPRPVCSPRPLQLSPRPPPPSPKLPPPSQRINLPISPGTPKSMSPNYNPRMVQQHSIPSPRGAFVDPQLLDNPKGLTANSKSRVADVEVKFAGPNLLLNTTSLQIPGQALKIISALESLALEVLHVSISTVDKTMFNSFTIKIGIECQLSAEELANEIQQTFCCAEASNNSCT